MPTMQPGPFGPWQQQDTPIPCPAEVIDSWLRWEDALTPGTRVRALHPAVQPNRAVVVVPTEYDIDAMPRYIREIDRKFITVICVEHMCGHRTWECRDQWRAVEAGAEEGDPKRSTHV